MSSSSPALSLHPHRSRSQTTPSPASSLTTVSIRSTDSTGGIVTLTVTSQFTLLSTGSSRGASPTTKAQGSSHRNPVPTPALIGIVLGISSMISLTIFLLWLNRRRRRKSQVVHEHEYANVVATPYPILFADIAAAIIPSTNSSADNSDARSITKVRQQYLRNELRAAQEKIVHVQNSERRTSTSRATRGARAVGRSLWLFTGRGASDTSGRDPEVVMREMAARIRELEVELESPWARGLSDEPPPGYSEGEA
ncbi:hypothetical protein C8F04DRAFT_1264580 [Mycena alexandri]|uniref:Uncharacterized protein n=1 Tax=Mycena alexandri TaxID=1745969 RepID=A0AAD6WWD7_9AGAR|nr:hypothetical protein C8F04DRAFT_1264580 [Mycena alexandri]